MEEGFKDVRKDVKKEEVEGREGRRMIEGDRRGEQGDCPSLV